jgi:hypothetical protein
MLYKIENGKTVFESNPGLDSNEVFAKCSDRELRYVFLLYDVESPYINMRFKDRQHKAASEAGYKKEKDGKRFDRNAREVLKGSRIVVRRAIAEFKLIQQSSNTNYSILETVKTQIERNLNFIENVDEEKMTVKEMIDLNKLTNGLQELIQTKVNIETILNVDPNVEEEQGQDELVGNLSMLDQVNIED